MTSEDVPFGEAGRPKCWVMIVPFFKPAPGGCAVYIDIIARALAEAGDRVLIVTERHPGTPREEVLEGTAGRVAVRREFPFRAGRSKKDWRSFVAYAEANLRYLRLPQIVRRFVQQAGGPVRTLVHTSLFYNPNSLKYLLKYLRGDPKGTLIADVRDMQYPDAELGLLDAFDSVVTSSIGVAADLVARGVEPRKVVQIPMPFEFPAIPTPQQAAAVLEKYGVAPGTRFLLNPNGISRAKHYPAMREAIGIIRAAQGFEDVILLSVGRDRDRTAVDDAAEKAGAAKYLGPVSSADLLALMQSAWLTLVLSADEAISRAALEAMAVGGKVVLPDVAEFRAECASHICSDPHPRAIAELVIRLAEAPMPRFGFERHMEPNFLPLYRGLATAPAQASA